MISHKNRLLVDISHEISYLIFSKIRKDAAKFVVCCSRDWRFKGCKYYGKYSKISNASCLPKKGLNKQLRPRSDSF